MQSNKENEQNKFPMAWEAHGKTCPPNRGKLNPDFQSEPKETK